MARKREGVRMPQSPEVEHLQRAVDAVRKGLLPEKKTDPEPESDVEMEPAEDMTPKTA